MPKVCKEKPTEVESISRNGWPATVSLLNLVKCDDNNNNAVNNQLTKLQHDVADGNDDDDDDDNDDGKNNVALIIKNNHLTFANNTSVLKPTKTFFRNYSWISNLNGSFLVYILLLLFFFLLFVTCLTAFFVLKFH
jgi:hypothetical protein